MLREAADLLQPLLAGGTLLEGRFRLVCAPGGLPQHGAHGAAGVRVPARHAATHAAAPAALPRAMDGPAFNPMGRLRGLFSWRGSGRPARGEGHWRANTRSCVQSVRGQWVWPGRAATVGGRQAGAVPPVSFPPAASLGAVQAGVGGSGALLRAVARGPPNGSGGVAAPSRVLQAWLAPLEPPTEPLAKRPSMAPVPAVAGRHQWPDCRLPSPPARRGLVQSTLP